jgi:L-amino acid N-acyltransferase YncA
MTIHLQLCPVTLREAFVYVEQNHRHHRAPQGGLFAVGVTADGETICGIAIVGRPVARHLNDDWTAEVTRLVTNGTKNACSKLYGACWRAARSLGYRRLVAYTLPEEGGASLRAAGFYIVAQTKAEGWSRRGRPRVDLHPTQRKLRWERRA